MGTTWDYLDRYRGKEFTGEWPNIAQLMHLTVMNHPENDCFQSIGKDGLLLTFRQVEDKVKQVASRLKELGVNKNSHIAVSGKNSVQWGIAFLSIMYVGAVAVPLDNTLHENEVKNLVEFGDIDWFFGDSDRLEYAKQTCTHIFTLTPDLKEKDVPYVMDMSGSNPDDWSAFKPSGDDIAVIMFTSGTTGTPKGVMLTHDNIVSCGFKTRMYVPCDQSDVFYAVLPIHHAYTFQADFIQCISMGCKLVFGQKFIPAQIFREVKEGGVTMFITVPLLFNKILKSIQSEIKKKGLVPYKLFLFLLEFSGFLRDVFKLNLGRKFFRNILDKISLSGVKVCISGGGPLPVETSRFFYCMGLNFIQGYGSTETSPITHLNPVNAFRSRSVGKLLPTFEHKIINPDKNGNGELLVRGSSVMKGYYKNPQATAEVLTDDLWYHTGDVGYIDKDDYFYLTGRAKNMIVLDGGKNVFPEEIEDLFQLYVELEQVCVVDYKPDSGISNIGIKLLVYPSETMRKQCDNVDTVIEQRVRNIVSEVNKQLQSYKKITAVEILKEPLETTSTRKIKRALIKKN